MCHKKLQLNMPPQKSPNSEINNSVSVPAKADQTQGKDVSTNSENTDINTNKTGETVPVAKKKGWSDAAKGAVIGGAAGAIGGAIINGKNRGTGAIIGAVIGAAGGYVIGRKRDKNKEANPFSMVVN